MRTRRFICHSFLAVGTLILASGCGQSSSDEEEAQTMVAHAPSRSLSDPLTEQEVRLFLEVIKNSPNGQLPAFAPLSQATISSELGAAHLVQAYRQEYRAMFDASRHGERWRQDSEVMRVLSQSGVEPEDFAALVIRISCAIAANSISSQVDLMQTSAQAESQLQVVVDRLSLMDNIPSSTAVRKRRQPYIDTLQQLVALTEFSQLLVNVPPESREVIATHRHEILPLIPPAGDARMFEQTIESQVVPTSFDRAESSRERR